MRRSLTVVGGAALVAALLSGCSSDDGASGDGSPSASSSSSEATSGEAVTEAGQEFCNALEEVRRVQEDPDADPQALQDSVDDLVDAAPDGGSPELQRIGDAYDEYADQVEGLIGDVPDVPGVDLDQLLAENRDRLAGLSEQYLEPVRADLEQVLEQGRADCDSAP